MIVNPLDAGARIEREVYGHFAEHLGRCVYGGVFVGEDSPIPNVRGVRSDVVAALRAMDIPVLRWPGGCFADEYHWRDGVGPRAARKKMVNSNWGGVEEDNSFGTHEFMDLCGQLGCKAYISGNLGSGAVRELSEWVEYLTFGGVSPMAELRAENGRAQPWALDFLGIGNESWGCGGNMTPEYYAHEYLRYATFCRDHAPGRRLYKIACGANADDYDWTDRLMRTLTRVGEGCALSPLYHTQEYTRAFENRFNGDIVGGISLHYYTIPHDWTRKGRAVGFDRDAYYLTLQKALMLDELIARHSAIMDYYDPEGRVGLIVDEWGAWYDVEPEDNPHFLFQQNTMRDALIAAVSLNIFHRHAGRVKMANLAQLVNVLQAVVLTEGERMLLTPTYHVFRMMKRHQGARSLSCFTEEGCAAQGVPRVHASASRAADGRLNLTAVNLSADEACDVRVSFLETELAACAGEILTGAIGAHNTFDAPQAVRPATYTDYERAGQGLTLHMPPVSVVQMTLTPR